MQRRQMLAWSVASMAVLATAGGALALRAPGWHAGRLGAGAREVMAALSQGLLDGTLSTDAGVRPRELQALLLRIEDLIAGLPAHAQAELSQLLALLASAPGRRWLAGVDAPWAEATPAQVQAGLTAMRTSSVSLRLQAYQALHDIVGGAYFSDPATWGVLGYPGPRVLDTAPATQAKT